MSNTKTVISTIAISIFLLIFFISCKEKGQPNDISTEKFEHHGLLREYIYYAPDNLKKEAPLVVVLHGFTSSAKKIMDYSALNKIAKENNFAVVYPQGTRDGDSNTFWNVGYSFHSDIKTDDVDYVITLVKHLQNKYDLSVTNTFVTGMSNGAELCYLLICEHPNIFKATAPVAGMMLNHFFDNCDNENATPVFAVFGTDDDVTNFNGDPNNTDGWGAYISIPSTIEYWAKRIDYDAVTIDTLSNTNHTDNSFIVSERYLNTTNKKEVLFYKVINGGHDWPGAWGNMDISASHEIWNFFEKNIN
ncbi:MAG: prolyl oligopeptidase family serine peptidase [Flavobacteriaceae bacterium]|nr:prolyl oligopeptidase family serine peptidase [Flavobacteriaceae bacterium]